MKQYSIYDNIARGCLTAVNTKDETEAHTKGYYYGYEQSYDKKEFIGITVIPPQDT